MGVRADDGWSFICGLKKPSTSCFSFQLLTVTGSKAGLLYLKLNRVILMPTPATETTA